MIKAIIRNNGKILDEQCGSDLESLQAWLTPFEQSGVYGKPAYSYRNIISPVILDEEFNEISPEVFEMISVAAEYEIEFIDISEQNNQEQSNQEAEQFLAVTDWKILRHIGQQSLGLATSLTAEEYQELEQQRQMAREAIIRE